MIVTSSTSVSSPQKNDSDKVVVLGIALAIIGTIAASLASSTGYSDTLVYVVAGSFSHSLLFFTLGIVNKVAKTDHKTSATSITPTSYDKKGKDAYDELNRQTLFALTDSNKIPKTLGFKKLPKRVPNSFPLNKTESDAAITLHIPIKTAENMACTVGAREKMEDGFFKIKFPALKAEGFAIIDGHGDDKAVTLHFRETFPKQFQEQLIKSPLTDETITTAFVDCIEASARKYKGKGGAVLAFAFLVNHKLYVANLGDCRTLLVTKDKIFQLSEDDSASKERFRKTYEDTPGIIWHKNYMEYPGIGRFQMTRHFGNDSLCHRPIITHAFEKSNPEAEDQLVTFKREESYLVMGTDGVWGSVSNKEVADFIRKMANEDPELTTAQMAARILYLVCQRSRGKKQDNATLVIVNLARPATIYEDFKVKD